LFLSSKLDYEPMQGLLTILKHSVHFLSFLFLFFVIQRFTDSSIPAIVVSILAAVYYVFISLLIGYWLYWGSPPDYFFAADAVNEIIPTVLQVLGAKLAIYIPGFLLLGVLYYFLFIELFGAIKNISAIPVYTVLIMFILGIGGTSFIISNFSSGPTGFLEYEIEDIKSKAKARSVVYPLVPDNSQYSTKSAENVFILQLESVHSQAANGDFTFDGKEYPDRYTPHIKAIAEDGLYFPYFWGNSKPTNRAQATILCGVVGNIRRGLSHTPKRIRTPCLPELFDKSGYEALVFRSDNLNFSNTYNFFTDIGFEEIHHKDIMNESDREYYWGYDDCQFYKRVFEYLKKNYPRGKKLFVYIEVSSHHYPYGTKKGYEFLELFENPRNKLERYLNSLAYEDYCAGKFYEEYKNYSPSNSHLFIVPDTAINLNYDLSDHHIPIAYVPPSSRKREFFIGKQVNKLYSQSDIIPTIFSLLNNKNYQNSFAFELRKKSKKNYEDCHIITHPRLGTSVNVVKGLDMYSYLVKDEIVEFYNSTSDSESPEIINEDLTYTEFKHLYFCDRYKEKVRMEEIFRGPVHIGDSPIGEKWKDYWGEFEDPDPSSVNFKLEVDEVGFEVNSIIIEKADVNRRHEIFINNKHVGDLCTKLASCVVNLDKSLSKNFTIKINNTPNSERKTYDDYIIYSIKVSDKALT